MDSININNLTLRLGKQIIFNNLSFQSNYGSIVGIIGPNGIGKSMLFKIISGLVIPQKGNIIVNSENITKHGFPDSFGALIEEPGFIGRLSGYANLDILASIQNKISYEDIDKTLKLVGLWKNRNKKVKHYSLGMKKKLGIAQAIMEHPKVIVLDEPMNALDNESVVDIKKILITLSKNNTNILLASHNMDDIKSLCDKVYRINNKKMNQIKLN